MAQTRTLSAVQAERKQRAALRKADSKAGTLSLDSVPAGTMNIEPVATNPDYWGGELWIFEADDATLLRNGLVSEQDLPKAATGCKLSRLAGRDVLKTCRIKDGRVRLTISAHLVRTRDASFVDFLSRTVGGAVISGVMGKQSDE